MHRHREIHPLAMHPRIAVMLERDPDAVIGTGVMTRNDGTITLEFTGLDPTLRYDFAIFGNRINDAGVTANEDFVLVGADSFDNISSLGATTSATFLPGDTTSFETRANTVNGYIARWTNINPGIDGAFTIEAREVGTDAGVVYLNAARLEVIPEPSKAMLLAIGLLGLLVRRRR